MPIRRSCVRALSGPLAGSVWPLEERLEIGRASSSDIQLVTVGVSRQHAVVLRNEDGIAIVDMLSTNGTWIGGEKVQRQVLQPGDRFTVGQSEFLFEPMTDESEFTAPPAKRIADARTHRPTQRLVETPTPPPRPQPAWRNVPHAMLATGPDGKPYNGNVLGDIVLYRNLRLRMVRSGRLDETLTSRYDQLQVALRMPPANAEEESDLDRRAFARFICDVPGKLGFDDRRGPDDAIQLLDVAIDGARITAPSTDVQTNALCWLSLPLIGPQGLRTVVFTSRVVWVRPDELGIVFSGAPSWAARSRDREDGDTQPLFIGRTKKSDS